MKWVLTYSSSLSSPAESESETSPLELTWTALGGWQPRPRSYDVGRRHITLGARYIYILQVQGRVFTSSRDAESMWESESPVVVATSKEFESESVRSPQWKSESESEQHHHDSETLAGVRSLRRSRPESWQRDRSRSQSRSRSRSQSGAWGRVGVRVGVGDTTTPQPCFLPYIYWINHCTTDEPTRC